MFKIVMGILATAPPKATPLRNKTLLTPYYWGGSLGGAARIPMRLVLEPTDMVLGCFFILFHRDFRLKKDQPTSNLRSNPQTGLTVQ